MRALQTFTLEPNAWMEAFGFRCPKQQQEITDRLLARIRHLEERAERLRAEKKMRVMGREMLNRQVFDLSYRSKRTGRRMWCLSEKRSVRVAFITFFKKLMQTARAVPYPPGLYPPSMPKLANVFGHAFV